LSYVVYRHLFSFTPHYDADDDDCDDEAEDEDEDKGEDLHDADFSLLRVRKKRHATTYTSSEATSKHTSIIAGLFLVRRHDSKHPLANSQQKRKTNKNQNTKKYIHAQSSRPIGSIDEVFVVLESGSYGNVSISVLNAIRSYLSSKNSKAPSAPSLHPLRARPASRSHPSSPLLPHAMLISRQALGLIIDHGPGKLLAASIPRNATLPARKCFGCGLGTF